MTAHWTERLSEYLDGTLTPEEHSACEAWLTSSAEGRMLLHELREVVAKAKTLPERPVPEALWAGVQEGIRAAGSRGPRSDVLEFPATHDRPLRRVFSPMQLVVAAAVLLTVGTGIGFALRGSGAPSQVALSPLSRPPVTTGVTIRPVAARADASYDKAVQELQIILQQNRATMDSATVRVLESSLARIDAALTEAQRALDNDPHSAYLNDHLSRIKRKKLDLLRQGASLVQAS